MSGCVLCVQVPHAPWARLDGAHPKGTRVWSQYATELYPIHGICAGRSDCRKDPDGSESGVADRYYLCVGGKSVAVCELCGRCVHPPNPQLPVRPKSEYRAPT